MQPVSTHTAKDSFKMALALGHHMQSTSE